MVKLLLVDGVGNAVIIERPRQTSMIVICKRTFEGTDDYRDGLKIYRLVGCGKPTIRRINVHLVRSDAGSDGLASE